MRFSKWHENIGQHITTIIETNMNPGDAKIVGSRGIPYMYAIHKAPNARNVIVYINSNIIGK